MRGPNSLTLLNALVLLVSDVIAFTAAMRLAHALRLWNDAQAVAVVGPFERLSESLSVYAAALLVVFFIDRLYLPRRGTSRVDVLFAVVVSLSKAMILGLALSMLLQVSLNPPRLMLLYWWVLGGLAICSGRIVIDWVFRWVRARGLDEERVLIIGAGESGRIVVDRLQQAPELGYHVVGFVDVDSAASLPGAEPLLGSLADVVPLIRSHGIGEVIIAQPSLSQQQILEVASSCARERVSVKLVPDLLQIMSTEVSTSDLTGLPLMHLRDVGLRGWNLALKRAMDVMVSAVLLVLLSPLLLFIALLVKLTSRQGPVFFTQERVGLDDRPFHLIKFRSMRPNAEAATGPVWASHDDDRRTPLGTFMRRFSIDELPQLVNVLAGEMSLVGPRPERPHFVEQFRRIIPRYAERHNEKAGITGWAQVNGLRGNTSIEERTKYDIFYVEHWSVPFDVKILLKTVATVLRDKNAY